MAIKEFMRRLVPSSRVYAPSIFVPAAISKVSEQFQGKVIKHDVKFPRELGEEHPFDFAIPEGLYKKFGMVKAIVEKYIDYIVGPGFYVTSEDEKAKTIIEQFMQDTNFDTLLRSWLKEALTKGTGFLELGGPKTSPPQGMKILSAKYMYIQRDDEGKVLQYNQYFGRLKDFAQSEVTPFKLHQIAALPLNTVGDEVYGQGIVYSAVDIINSLLGNRKEMQTLLKRKANAPLHVKMGNVEKDMMPTPEDVAAFGEKLEFLNNKHEWATDALVEMKVLDFGEISEKFSFVIEHDLDMLFFTFQVPEVLMGRKVNLATAPVQMDAFERRIQSIQAEVEKVIEREIFSRVLLANGLDTHVEFEWGQRSNTQKMERLDKVTNLLKLPTLSLTFSRMLEEEAAQLLDFDEEELKTEEEQRQKEAQRSQPLVPGQNQEHYDVPKGKIFEGELVGYGNA